MPCVTSIGLIGVSLSEPHRVIDVMKENLCHMPVVCMYVMLLSYSNEMKQN